MVVVVFTQSRGIRSTRNTRNTDPFKPRTEEEEKEEEEEEEDEDEDEEKAVVICGSNTNEDPPNAHQAQHRPVQATGAMSA